MARTPMIPGEIFVQPGDIELNEGRKTKTLTVSNGGDRPIQIGSHFHFYEVNSAMKFDRDAAYGMRLNEIIMYCGGGYRSVLTASAAQKMGYGNVCSLVGGYKALEVSGKLYVDRSDFSPISRERDSCSAASFR